jgi:hypothetical protein
MLLAELADFVTRHRPSGQLTGDAIEPEANGYMVTVGCSCGVVSTRPVTSREAGAELASPDVVTGARRPSSSTTHIRASPHRPQFRRCT